MIYFFLYFPIYGNEHFTILSSLAKIDKKLLDSTDSPLTQALLCGILSFNTSDNTKIINSEIDYALSTKRFDGLLL